MKKALRVLTLAVSGTFLFGSFGIWPGVAHAACADESGVCVDGGTWKNGERLSKGARKKTAKKNRRKGQVALTVEIEGGRGSAFVDGRYLEPGTERGIKPGKHDVQLRDGDAVIAQGVLTIPGGASEVVVTAVHP